MLFSDNISELAQALTAAQAELKNPYNTADNPFYKSKYAPLPDVLNIIRPILAKHGLSIVQMPKGEGTLIGVETLVLHNSGQYILCEPYFLPLAKNDAQAAGGAITYARRYALNAVLGISGEEDDDANQASGKQDGSNPKEAQAQKGSPAPLVCPKCGKEIKAVKGKDGEIVSPADVLQKLNMCSNCYKKDKHGQEAAENGKQ